jgi:hypothetical protein
MKIAINKKIFFNSRFQKIINLSCFLFAIFALLLLAFFSALNQNQFGVFAAILLGIILVIFFVPKIMRLFFGDTSFTRSYCINDSIFMCEDETGFFPFRKKIFSFSMYKHRKQAQSKIFYINGNIKALLAMKEFLLGILFCYCFYLNATTIKSLFALLFLFFCYFKISITLHNIILEKFSKNSQILIKNN